MGVKGYRRVSKITRYKTGLNNPVMGESQPMNPACNVAVTLNPLNR